MTKTIEKLYSRYIQVRLSAQRAVCNHWRSCLFIFGAMILLHGLSGVAEAQVEPNYNDTLIRQAVVQLFALIEGAFGALIMVVAGLGAIVASAMGAYRAALGMLVVAVGAFILRALVSLFFGEFIDLEPISN